MSIGILERAGIAAPKCVMRRIGDRGACLACLLHHRIHFGLARDIVTERKFGGASRTQGHLGFVCERCAGPDGKFQTMLKIEESDCAMLELCADDALRRQTEPIAIKLQRSF